MGDNKYTGSHGGRWRISDALYQVLCHRWIYYKKYGTVLLLLCIPNFIIYLFIPCTTIYLGLWWKPVATVLKEALPPFVSNTPLFLLCCSVHSIKLWPTSTPRNEHIIHTGQWDSVLKLRRKSFFY
jgi:hypothetical protein